MGSCQDKVRGKGVCCVREILMIDSMLIALPRQWLFTNLKETYAVYRRYKTIAFSQ